MATNKKVAPKKTVKKPAAKKAAPKKAEQTDATQKIDIPEAVVTVQDKGDSFLVTETSPDGGVYQSYESDTNPLEEAE